MSKHQTLPHELDDAISLETLLRNIRPNLTRAVAREPNWVVVMKVFALGSTYSHWLCRELGFDPDGMSFDRATSHPERAA